METKIKNNIETYINDHLEEFPFIARFWDVDVVKTDNNDIVTIAYGHYGTEGLHATPFYKPISKIIDLSIINEQ